MNRTPKVMLLIDADNVSADVIEQALAHATAEHGAVHLRRAYCNAETAVKQQALFKRLSVRPMVNLSAGKNSTDIALAVDAIDLVLADRPEVVVLVSSDADFAPLVIRLREKGCRVCGIGQQGKTGDDTVGVYDSFVDLAHQRGGRSAATVAPGSIPAPESATAPTTARKSVAAKTAAKPAAKASRAKSAPPASAASTATVSAASGSDTVAAPAKKTARRAATKKIARTPAPPAPSEAATFVLDAVPALRSGKEVPLNDAAQALRAAGLLGKHGSSLKLFDKLTAEFAVLHQPDRIRWTGAPAA